jgi:CBS-domain-containing membrane protein
LFLFLPLGMGNALSTDMTLRVKKRNPHAKEPNMIARANSIATRSMLLRLSTAAELMTTNPLSFKQGDSLQKVAALLSFHEFDAAPVTDDAGRLVGLISAEACAAWEAYSRRSSPHGFSLADLDETDISEIVSPIVQRVRDDATSQEVIDLLGQRKARRVYVVNSENELVGVISMTDLLRLLGNGSSSKPVHRAAAALLC